MAVTLEQKVDFLLKKIGYVVAKTGAAEGSASSVGQQKLPTQEAISSPLVIPSGTVWTESDSIPATPPSSTSGVVEVVGSTSNLFSMTEDPTVSGDRSWIAYSTYNDTTSAIKNNWIDPGNFGPGYQVRVFNFTTSDEILPDDPDKPWFFDYSAGVLNFTGNGNSPTPNLPVKVIGYRYTGDIGVGGADIEVSETAPTDPSQGSLWWNSSNGDLLIYYDDGQIANNQGTSAQWVSAITGGGGFWSLDPATNTISTTYTISAPTKNFRIDHPLPELRETHDLVYTSAEGPSADLLFHGTVQLVNGNASINIDNNSNQTNGTFESLCGNIKCFTENTTDWTPVRGKVEGNILNIEAKDSNCEAIVDWMIIGTRKDGELNEIPTSGEDGEFYPEVLKG